MKNIYLDEQLNVNPCKKKNRFETPNRKSVGCDPALKHWVFAIK